MKAISLRKLILNYVEGISFDTDEKRALSAGADFLVKSNMTAYGQIQLPLMESRASLQATTPNSGGEIPGVDVTGLIAPIRANLATVQAGATLLTGLKGDVKVPIYAGTTAKWKGEGLTADEGAGAFTKVELKPKRITAFIDVSKQFLEQDTVDAEAMLLNDMAAAVTGKLEGTIFGKEAGSATQPEGFFASAPSIKGAVTYENLLLMEAAVTFNDRLQKPAYITNAAGRTLLKKTPKVPNQADTILSDNGNGLINGYPGIVTNHVATDLQAGLDEEGIVFGDWSQLLVGLWGIIDITVDPYSRALLGEVRLTVNAYVDAAPRLATAFATGSMK